MHVRNSDAATVGNRASFFFGINGVAKVSIVLVFVLVKSE